MTSLQIVIKELSDIIAECEKDISKLSPYNDISVQRRIEDNAKAKIFDILKHAKRVGII